MFVFSYKKYKLYMVKTAWLNNEHDVHTNVYTFVHFVGYVCACGGRRE